MGRIVEHDPFLFLITDNHQNPHIREVWLRQQTSRIKMPQLYAPTSPLPITLVILQREGGTSKGPHSINGTQTDSCESPEGEELLASH